MNTTNAQPDQIQSSTMHFFDVEGDVKLLPSPSTGYCVFVVSSKVLTLTCSFFKVLLGQDSRFRDVPIVDGYRIVELHGDEPEAMAVLMNIAHLRFEHVPQAVSFDLLRDISVLTDKYGATRIVQPFLKKWMREFKTLEDYIHREEWIWIAWEFGFKAMFEGMVRVVLFTGHTDEHGRWLSTRGKVLDRWLPDGLRDDLKAVRKELARHILDMVWSTLGIESIAKTRNRKLRPVQICYHGDAECESLIRDSFLNNLAQHDVFPDRKVPSRLSLIELTAIIVNMAIRVKGGHVRNPREDMSPRCFPLMDIKEGIEWQFNLFRYDLQDSHKRHLEQQAAPSDYNPIRRQSAWKHIILGSRPQTAEGGHKVNLKFLFDAWGRAEDPEPDPVAHDTSDTAAL